MISIKMKQLAFGVALVVGAIGGAQAAAVDSLSITGGTFGMNAPGSDQISAGVLSPIQAGSYQGGPAASPADYSNSLADFQFGAFGPVHTFTAASVAGISGGGPAPSGTVDEAAGTITMDMSSFFAWWNGNSFNQGGTATGTYDGTTGNYSMSWTSLINGGPFDNNTGYWTLQGIATLEAPAPIPLPAAVWLMGSGLLGMVGVARRKKSVAKNEVVAA